MNSDPIVQHRLAKKARIVPQSQRITLLPKLFGTRSMLLVENMLYRWADRLLPEYKGSYWDMLRIDGGGFYMVPTSQARWKVFIEGNGYSGEVSADAAGVVLCSMLYSHMSFEAAGDLQKTLVQLFEQLQLYIDGHPEASDIYSALD